MVLVNFVDLIRLLSLSSALVACFKVPTESSAIIKDKDEMLVAIDHISPSVLEEVHIEKDQKQDDTMPTSGKLSDIPSFSIALQWQIAEKNK